MAELDGKVAVITGGASGIGEASVRLFVEEGARVVIADMQRERGESLAAELGDATRFVQVEVRQEDQVKGAIDTATNEWGRLDCIFNNAGFGVYGSSRDLTVEAEQAMIDVNARALHAMARAFLPLMEDAGGGLIVNVASNSAFVPTPGLAVYAATKAAVSGMTRSFAREWVADGIRVNCIEPAVVQTEFTKPLWGEEHRARWFADTTPIGRLAQAEGKRFCRIVVR